MITYILLGLLYIVIGCITFRVIERIDENTDEIELSQGLLLSAIWPIVLLGAVLVYISIGIYLLVRGITDEAFDAITSIVNKFKEKVTKAISREDIIEAALKHEQTCSEDMKKSFYQGFCEGAKWMQHEIKNRIK